MGEINQQKSKEAVNKEIQQSREGFVKNAQGKWVFAKGHKRLAGDRTGTKNKKTTFDMMFDEAIEEIIKNKELKIDNPEKMMMVKAMIEALKGNLGFWRALSEWRYGKPKETIEAKIGILNINQLIDDLNSGKFPEIEG